MQDEHVLIGLDIGTSGVRALAFTSIGDCLGEGRATFRTDYPEPGQAEQNPADWWHASIAALQEVSMQLGSQVRRVAGIGLTGQCPTFTCVLPSGEPAGPGLLYQDNRASTETDFLIQQFGAIAIHKRSGQAPTPFYILPKLLWLRQRQRMRSLAGTIIVQPRDLVGWHLTGRFATDPTHAACTLAYDLSNKDWALDWMDELGLGEVIWPEIIPSRSILGSLHADAAAATGLLQGTPVIIGAADSICAAYGAHATTPGVLCEVTGTSTCLHLTSTQPAVEYAINTYPHIKPGTWCTELGLNTTGGALAWLAELLEKPYEHLLQAASVVPAGAEGLLFLPHLSGGERDKPGRQGAFVGLELGHSVGHIARAVLEGVAYGIRQRVTLLEDSGYHITHMVSCGGAARNTLWTQIKANILDMPVEAVTQTDTTAWGVALIAGEALDIHSPSIPLPRTRFLPLNTDAYRVSYERFCQLEKLLTCP